VAPLNVYTAGYEDRGIDEFITRLKSKKVNIVVDVREVPASRRAGFSKKVLMYRLKEEGFKYVHLKELGSPKSLREKVRKDGDFSKFFEEYRKYVASQMSVLRKLYRDIVSKETTCIMCFERLHYHCHRTIVAEIMKEMDDNGLLVTHI
jgi:uncharacterized protein (DUF488 family)